MGQDSDGNHIRSAPRQGSPGRLRVFLQVVGAAVGLLFGTLMVDTIMSKRLLLPQDEGIAQGLGSLGEILAAVLGLSITVVAIVLQLASQRYSPKIVDLFMRDPVNVKTSGFMVVSCIYVVMLPTFAGNGQLPEVAMWAGFVLTAANFGLLLPYFGHVFEFLQPNNFITQIKTVAKESLNEATQNPKHVPEYQRQVADAVERIADNCLSAISLTDRGLALHSIRTLDELLIYYLHRKASLPDQWARIPQDYFLSLSREFYEEIVDQGTWVEAKVFMELEHVIRRSLGSLGEVVSQIATSTRNVGSSALRVQDQEVTELVVRFFNTYIRHALNRRDVRALYNILYQYQLFSREVMETQPDLCRRIVQHLVYYGRLANEMRMPFVTVTAAHDVRVLCEKAFQDQHMDVVPLLDLFLSLDQPSEAKTEELALIGVRKAQSILGAFFLEQGAINLVNRIRHDMSHESLSRMLLTRDEILAVTERKFWEITDRGINFDYIEPERHQYVRAFFEPLLQEDER